MRYGYKRFLGGLGFLAVAAGVSLFAFTVSTLENSPIAHAAATITVNSQADDYEDDGECTLREAIIAANDDAASGVNSGECIAGSGADTINFNITGTADFSNGGQNGYTITPGSGLPNITEQLTINGYSQTGAQPNTAISPNPLNGRLLVEIDGTNAGLDQAFTFDGDDITVRGLAINNFTGADSNRAFSVNGNNNFIVGNYIGSDPTGMIGEGNEGVAIQVGGDTSSNLHIGGTNPADRNIIVDNKGGGIGTGAGHNDWVIQGNYVGLAADGITPIGNSTTGQSGGLSIDDDEGTLIGGDASGAINVISGNLSMGIAPHNATDLEITGNLIGTDYTGYNAVPNGATGINISGSEGSIVRNNIISGNSEEGLSINTSTDLVITGNRVSNNTEDGININTASNVRIEGNTSYGNTEGGLRFQNVTDVVVGGTNSSKRNYFYGNSAVNLMLSGVGGAVSDVVIQGNFIGVDQAGVVDDNTVQGNGLTIQGSVTNSIIGGVEMGAGNRIAGNGDGINVVEVNIPGPTSFSPSANAILGNSIFSNMPGSYFGISETGIGIDIFSVTLDGGFVPQTIEKLGPTSNDPGDPDNGPNNYMNFPVLNTASQAGTNLDLTYDLDTADSPSNTYRVEFFANDAADPTGYGEGQTFLGAITSTNGSNKSASLTLPDGLNLDGKMLSATTTAIDNTTTSGYGATSEFALSIPVEVTTTTLAETGESPVNYIFAALSFLMLGVYLFRMCLVSTFRLRLEK